MDTDGANAVLMRQHCLRLNRPPGDIASVSTGEEVIHTSQSSNTCLFVKFEIVQKSHKFRK